MKLLHIVFCGLALSFTSLPSYAFNIYWNCPSGITPFTWANSFQNIRVRPQNLTTALVNEIRDAGDSYQNMGKTGFNLFTIQNNAAASFGDGINQAYVDFGTTFAQTKFFFATVCDNQNNGTLIEADVNFAPNNLVGGQRRWSDDPSRLESAGRPFYIGTVAVHEFGHWAGSLGNSIDSTGTNVPGLLVYHERRVLDSMNQYPGGGYKGGNGSSAVGVNDFTVSPLGDTRGMLRFLYPSNFGTRNDVAGSRFTAPTAAGSNNSLYRGDIIPGTTANISRGQGILMPYGVMNLGSEQRDVRIEVWMASDGILDGSSGDIQVTNGGSPLYHLYTMSPNGDGPDDIFPNTTNPTTVDNNIWFNLPSSSTTLPSGSQWIIGFRVSMDGVTDQSPNDNWVAYEQIYTVN